MRVSPLILVGGVGLLALIVVVVATRPESSTVPAADRGPRDPIPAIAAPTGTAAPAQPTGMAKPTTGNAPAAADGRAPAERPRSEQGGLATGKLTPPPRPPVRPDDLPPDHPPVSANEGEQTTIQWLGASCFYIHSPGGLAVVTDPFDERQVGLASPAAGAHAVTVSRGNAEHGHVAAVRAFEGEALEVLKGRPLRRKDMEVRPIPLQGGFAYSIQAGKLRILHLGDPRGKPDVATLKSAGPVDVLLLPAGGDGLSVKEAVQLAEALQPRVVIPMDFAAPGMELREQRGTVEDFVAASSFARTNKDADILLIAPADLPKSTEVWVLRYRR